MSAKPVSMLLTAAFLMPAALFAQDIDDLEPGVDTSAVVAEEPAVDTSAVADEPPSVDTEDYEPAVPTTTSSRAPRAIDSLELDATQVTGNQELPQVLYIVPWKASDLGDLVGRPVNTLLDEVLAPADREVFIRQIEYYEDLHGDSEEDS
ncbi:MAG: hypothetical protein AAF270_07060 [Pseudomonadota bacterium]